MKILSGLLRLGFLRSFLFQPTHSSGAQTRETIDRAFDANGVSWPYTTEGDCVVSIDEMKALLMEQTHFLGSSERGEGPEVRRFSDGKEYLAVRQGRGWVALGRVEPSKSVVPQVKIVDIEAVPAIVPNNVPLGEDTEVFPGAVIASGSRLGDRVKVGPGTQLLGAYASYYERSAVPSGVSVGNDVVFGREVKVFVREIGSCRTFVDFQVIDRLEEVV